MPANIQVPAGNKAFLVGHAVGTQNYICLPNDHVDVSYASGFAWTLFTPQATLFDDDDKQVTTHFFSPNPFERTRIQRCAAGTIRATWQHSRDTSTVWAEVTTTTPLPTPLSSRRVRFPGSC